MMKLYCLVAILLFSLVVGCVNHEAAPAVSFVHPKESYKVTPGAFRSEVESYLMFDQIGEKQLAEFYEKHFTFKRISNEQELDAVLNSYFGGGREEVRDLWSKYPNATFSALECDNYTIIFFDAQNKAVASWPSS